MRRLILLCVLAVSAMVVVPTIAGASHSEGDGPKQAKVNGTGDGSYGHVHVNAKNSPDGGPSGHFFVDGRQGDVTCLGPAGPDNAAVIGGRFRDDNEPVIIRIRDHGEPGRGRDQYAVREALPPEVAPPTCSPTGVVPFPPEANIERGNFIVHFP